MTNKQKDQDIARDHVSWYMSRFREQMNAWLNLTEVLLHDNFIHGIKHGRELQIEEEKLKKGDCSWIKKKS
jgi:hypothetical protein